MGIDYRSAFQPLEHQLITGFLIIIGIAMVVAMVARLVLFWVPNSIRRVVIGPIAGLGVLLGIYIATVYMK